MGDSHDTAVARARIGRLGFPLLLAGMVGYVLAADEGHWWAPEIVGRDCVAGEAGDNCTQVLLPGPDYVPHAAYAWLGWSAVLAFVAGLALVGVAIVRAVALRRILRATSGHDNAAR